jgi:hypothetical protein
MRLFEKQIRKMNQISSNLKLNSATFGTSTITTGNITTGNITTGNINNAVVATGLFHVLRIPTAAHNVSGSMWVSGNGSYFFIRAKGTTKSGSLA